MQSKGIVEPLYSVPGNPHNTTVLLDTIAKLKQDVKLCQQEKNAVIEQLNCLISLIKRSWSGDHNASLHLANIVGLPPPEFVSRAYTTPVPDKSARAVMLWERLSIKLLDRNYKQIQEEIKERQMLYMQNRQLYMDEILHSHQMDMAKSPVRKNSKTYEEVDKRFINTYGKFHKGAIITECGKKHTKPSPSPRPKQPGRMKQRVSSAPARPRTAKDLVEGSQLKMKDFFVPNKNGELQNTAVNGKQINLGNVGAQYSNCKNRLDYDDPQRYGQKNLFDLDSVFGPDSENKRPTRPVSAFIPRGQHNKSRPQSGNSTFLTQKSERPLKYETTRPISGKNQTKKTGSRLRSTSEIYLNKRKEDTESYTVENDQETVENEDEDDDNNNCHVQEDGSDSDFDIEEYNKPAMKVRVESAHPKRPAHVDQLSLDLKTMKDMEKDFKKSAISLQKKLGIDLNGMVGFE